jgi:hypothetical protein
LSFNPVLGFLSVATTGSALRPPSSTSFNPVLGFLSVATQLSGVDVDPDDLFQSRAGFSLRRDRV